MDDQSSDSGLEVDFLPHEDVRAEGVPPVVASPGDNLVLQSMEAAGHYRVRGFAEAEGLTIKRGITAHVRSKSGDMVTDGVLSKDDLLLFHQQLRWQLRLKILPFLPRHNCFMDVSSRQPPHMTSLCIFPRSSQRGDNRSWNLLKTTEVIITRSTASLLNTAKELESSNFPSSSDSGSVNAPSTCLPICFSESDAVTGVAETLSP